MTVRRHPEAMCEKCPLNVPGAAYVPSRLPTEPARLVVVGEAPGFQEAMYKQPFKGPSGRLLKKVLRHYGYKEQEVLFTNVCLCRPSDNATPPKAAVNACSPRLYSELANTTISDILALGGTAANALVDDPRTISHLRVGPPKPLTNRVVRETPARVIPTWHPAYCLRSADAFPALVTDIGKLKERDREPWREPQWRYTEDPSDARAIIAGLQVRKDVLVVDIEVGIDKDVSFDHPNEYDMLCVGIAYGPRQAVVLGTDSLNDGVVRTELGQLFRSKKLVAHNGKFDLGGLYPTLGALELWFDTMLASYCLDERPGNHGLKVLAVEKLGAPKYDDEIRRYIPRRGNYGDIPRPILYKYNAMDVACTWALYEMFSEALDRDGLRGLHDHLVAASNQLMYLELNGITVDIPYNFQLGEEFQGRIKEIEEGLDGIVSKTTEGRTPFINARSPAQVKAYLQSQGIRVDSTNVDTISRLLERLADGPVRDFLSTLLKHRKEQKLYSTYVEGIRKRTYRGRVYTTYMLHGTTSGRLASRNPNLQNIVRDKRIKRQFVTSKRKHILIHADYKQAEGRVITFLAQDDYLRSIFSDSNRDLFDELSDQLYGVGSWGKEERIRTKAFFYGLSYGRQAYSIAMEYNMSVREAERRLSEFMGLIPATVAWQQRTTEQVLKTGILTTPFGRKRRFHLITEQNKKDVLNEALSFPPQSIASDICLTALTRLRLMLRGLGFIRLTIHDALVVETPESRREEVSELLVSTMVECGREFTDYVPFSVDLSYGNNWGDL